MEKISAVAKTNSAQTRGNSNPALRRQFKLTHYPIPKEWLEYLSKKPETGMGYQVVSVTLKDGETYPQVVASDGFFTQVRGFKEVPFMEADVKAVKLNHKRWNFHQE